MITKSLYVRKKLFDTCEIRKVIHIKQMKKILSRMRMAVEKYNMIKQDDIIAVGVSGGKDSLVLLAALAEMRRFNDYSYDVIAITVDNGAVPAEREIFKPITEFCNALGVRHEIIRTEISEIVFNVRKEENPCSLCAKLRRGALHNAAEELGCTVLALGHHMDDVAETYMMNIMLAGRAGCFCPEMTYENSGIKLIRPFIYLREGEINGYASAAELPVIEKICPVDGDTERQHFKELLKSEDVRHRGVYKRILGALERSGIDGWKE